MKKIFEYNQYDEFNRVTDEEILEMSNISSKRTGIENVVIWVGPNPKYHWYRVKVSNIPNKFDGKNCFTIKIPDFEVIGKIDKSFIDKEKFNQIIEFLNLNVEIIKKYSDQEITTDELIDNLIKIK